MLEVIYPITRNNTYYLLHTYLWIPTFEFVLLNSLSIYFWKNFVDCKVLCYVNLPFLHNNSKGATHSFISGVLIQSWSAGAKRFTNYVFCHPQLSGVIQNNENCCAIRAKFWNSIFDSIKLIILIIIDIDKQESKWHNNFQYFG